MKCYGLTYTYKGNRLLGVNDASSNTEGFNDNGFTDVVIPEQENTHEYSYDNNGNMTQDLNKGVEYIKYNYLNKPYYISFNRSNYITYIYDAVGTKLKKTVHYNGTETSTDYVGDFVYHENTLSFAASETGRIRPQADGSFRNEYIIADHQPVGRQVLGNTRTLFTDANSDRIPEILQENHYDPFGMALGNLSYETPDGNNKYKYNGKELQDDLGLNWYDYGARMYDAAIGRWHVVDPIAEKYLSTSAYMYCLGNPVLLIDPDGRYSKIGAWLRSEFQGGSKIYKSGDEWGFNVLTKDNNGNITGYASKFGGNKSPLDDKNTNKRSFWNPSGGFHFTSLIGGGNEGRKGSSDVKSMNIDDLMGVLGAASRSTGTKNPLNLAEPIKYLFDMIGAGMDATEAVQKTIEGVKDLGTKKGEQRSSDTYECPTCDWHYSSADTAKHNEVMGRKSGPFKPTKKEE